MYVRPADQGVQGQEIRVEKIGVCSVVSPLVGKDQNQGRSVSNCLKMCYIPSLTGLGSKIQGRTVISRLKCVISSLAGLGYFQGRKVTLIAMCIFRPSVSLRDGQPEGFPDSDVCMYVCIFLSQLVQGSTVKGQPEKNIYKKNTKKSHLPVSSYCGLLLLLYLFFSMSNDCCRLIVAAAAAAHSCWFFQIFGTLP